MVHLLQIYQGWATAIWTNKKPSKDWMNDMFKNLDNDGSSDDDESDKEELRKGIWFTFNKSLSV